ncbi:prenyltransferase/squalene oxidase repeat-containing protein [Streptomyces sp. H27-D2]|uniref:prenyltransferase/squalene oxidase repeat-containing protein n=1 Tax=Streptomyces sp. H27-D2 TaxID=3046304 RepID=UPI002DB6D3F2|nr:prenyltransferase/squalene oxidase repeat-containing protein [Streptomyces sp. H27-D2]MEC4017760.1 prenyltransferase/squalene oxidase repeat-containing protein [Streptomyces sp. H27-D2]
MFAVPARRTCTALAAAAVLGTVLAPTAFADASPSPKAPAKLPAGLYGTLDPQYDGVWRQSLALLAQDTVGVTPAKKSVDWLAGQQCDDGAFPSFRAGAGKPCDAKIKKDTNQTAAAAQSLAALGGHSDAVRKAVTWLKSVQNDDGGWPSMPGGPSDANSTSLVLGTLDATGGDPEKVTSKKGAKNGYDALLAFRLGCDAKKGERGAFAFQPDKAGKLAANDDATGSAALGGLGQGFVVEPLEKDDDKAVTPLDCAPGGKKPAGDSEDAAEAAADAAAAYLSGVLGANGQHLKSAMPGAKDQPDVGNTADAILALAAGEHRDALAKPLAWLKKNSAVWAKQSGPAAYAQLVLTTHAAGGDPRDFGGADLVKQLNATGPKPAATEAPGKNDEKDDDGVGSDVWWYVGAFLVAGIGIGFLLSGRKKKLS